MKPQRSPYETPTVEVFKLEPARNVLYTASEQMRGEKAADEEYEVF